MLHEEIGIGMKELNKRIKGMSSNLFYMDETTYMPKSNLEKIAEDLAIISNINIETALFYLNQLKGTEYFDSLIEIEPIVKLYSDTDSIQQNSPDISTLKKRIKHCKNPLEKKNLQRELNQAYKNKKKGCM